MSDAAPSFDARSFDGRQAVPQAARVSAQPGLLEVAWPATGRSIRCVLASVKVSERLDRAPRVLELADGTVLHADETDTLRAVLARAGAYAGWVERCQRAWWLAALSLSLLACACAWLHVSGIPRIAAWAAEQVSPQVEARIGAQLLKTMDRVALRSSIVPSARQERIRARFAALVHAAAPDVQVRLEFRSEPDSEGLNAFALPGGTIVLLDGVVELSEDDDMVLGVLAHELGHQRHRHMTRAVFQAFGSVAIAGLLWGDYSSVASNSASALGLLRYSRENEHDADTFAFAALRQVGISPGVMSTFFEQVETTYHGRLPPEWLSTHPDPAQRSVRALEESYKRQ